MNDSDRRLSAQVDSSMHRQIQERGYATAVDVLMDIGALTKEDYEAWRRGGVEYLEKVCTMNLRRLSVAMKAYRRYGQSKGLKPSFTGYNTWGKGPGRRLRFSKSGDPGIERSYTTHYVDTAGVAQIKAGKAAAGETAAESSESVAEGGI